MLASWDKGLVLADAELDTFSQVNLWFTEASKANRLFLCCARCRFQKVGWGAGGRANCGLYLHKDIAAKV